MRLFPSLPAILLLCTHGISPAAETKAAPLKIMLITGGCCHDYKTQTEILKKGIAARITAEVTQMHVDDGSTKPPSPGPITAG